MRAVVQRVADASVTVAGERVAEIGPGLLVYVGVGADDTPDAAAALAAKIANLRIFPDAEGKLNRSVRDAGGAVMAVSAFTCQGDARKGNRPSFVAAAAHEVAQPLFERVADELERLVPVVRRGVFRAMMEVRSTNDGPIVILLDTERTF
jgi:D-tyrosyl-tRNA(Tyr) deacylase